MLTQISSARHPSLRVLCAYGEVSAFPLGRPLPSGRNFDNSSRALCKDGALDGLVLSHNSATQRSKASFRLRRLAAGPEAPFSMPCCFWASCFVPACPTSA